MEVIDADATKAAAERVGRQLVQIVSNPNNGMFGAVCVFQTKDGVLMLVSATPHDVDKGPLGGLYEALDEALKQVPGAVTVAEGHGKVMGGG